MAKEKKKKSRSNSKDLVYDCTRLGHLVPASTFSMTDRHLVAAGVYNLPAAFTSPRGPDIRSNLDWVYQDVDVDLLFLFSFSPGGKRACDHLIGGEAC